VEQFVYGEMVKKLGEFKTLTGDNITKVNPKLTALKIELAQVESEIEKLLSSLIGANATLLSYANAKIEELDGKRQALSRSIAEKSTEAASPEHIEKLSGYLGDWEHVSFDDKRLVVDGLIIRINATSEEIRIEWKI
jgi:hypothetical protein